MSRWSWIVRRIVRRIWFRAAIVSLLGVALAILAGVVTPYLPHSFDAEIGPESVGTILQIMAFSVLAVTTFSLTAMVGAYSSATQPATPRATQLMVGDLCERPRSRRTGIAAVGHSRGQRLTRTPNRNTRPMTS